MVTISFQEICNRIRQMAFPEVDRVVGIGSGGLVPASIIAFHLKKELSVLTINYRDENNAPRHDEPKVLNLPEKLLLESPAAVFPASPEKITGDGISHQSPGTEAGADLQSVPILEDELLKRKRILLVDDVSVSGKTLQTALELLKGHEIITFTLKGKADLVLFPEVGDCVKWPWKD